MDDSNLDLVNINRPDDLSQLTMAVRDVPVLRVAYESYVRDQPGLLGRIATEVALPADAWTLPPPEGRDTRLPAEVEAARERLLAQARAAYAMTAP